MVFGAGYIVTKMLLLLRVFSCLPIVLDIYLKYLYFVKMGHLWKEEIVFLHLWYQYCTSPQADLFSQRCHRTDCQWIGNFSIPSIWLFLVWNQGRPEKELLSLSMVEDAFQITSPAWTSSVTMTSMSTLSQGRLLNTSNSAPSMSRLSSVTVGLSRARRTENRGKHWNSCPSPFSCVMPSMNPPLLTAEDRTDPKYRKYSGFVSVEKQIGADQDLLFADNLQVDNLTLIILLWCA